MLPYDASPQGSLLHRCKPSLLTPQDQLYISLTIFTIFAEIPVAKNNIALQSSLKERPCSPSCSCASTCSRCSTTSSPAAVSSSGGHGSSGSASHHTKQASVAMTGCGECVSIQLRKYSGPIKDFDNFSFKSSFLSASHRTEAHCITHTYTNTHSAADEVQSLPHIVMRNKSSLKMSITDHKE